MLDGVWMSRYGTALIKPEYFEQEDEEAVAKAILDYKASYNRLPNDPDDVIALASVKYAELVYKIYDIYETGELSLAESKARDFARLQAVKLAVIESVDEINAGDVDQLVDRMKEAVSVGDSIMSPGIDPIRDVDKWLYEYWADKVRTGLHHLDMVLDGGLGVPELGVIMAPPNRGKSLALISIGYGAAGLGSGKNVVHFTHEMKVSQVCKRYAARMVFRFPSKEGNLPEYEDSLMEAARRTVPGKIRVIGGAYKMTFLEMRQHLDRLRSEGFDPGLIIDDYADLLIPSRRYTDRRFELSANYEELRAISEEYLCPVWTASQARREALAKEIITMADIAEDIGKANIADVIVALCQTYDEEQADQARLYLAKIRDSSRKLNLINCKYYGDSMALITTGFGKMKSKEQDA
jgi:replicative DNA helicase